jgi:hypothetical protein
MPTDMGTLTPEQMLQQQQILRQQKMAEMLMQQGMQQPQGQMISGHYVKPSIFQNLASLANTYVGQRGIEKAEQAQIDLAKRLREDEASATADYMQQKQGREGVEGGIYGPNNQLTKETTADMYGANMELNPQYKQVAPVAAIPPNPQAAYANLYANPKASAAQRQFAFGKMNEGPIKASLDDVLLDPYTLKPLYQGAGKKPSNIQSAAIVLGLDQKPIDQWTAQDRANIDAKIQETQRSGAANLGQKDFSNSLSLRKEFNNEPVYKGHQEIKSAWNTINVGLKQASPAGDLAAATKFMKLLDPTSVVRESELLLAMKASGALDRLYNYAQMRASGTLLTPTQRGDFKKLSDEFYQTAANQYNSKYGEYADIAKRNNLNPLDIGRPEAGIHNSQWGEVQVVK